jgi:hypothetical protein
MPLAPKNTLAQLNQVLQAWETLRPTKTFAGMTLPQCKAKLQPSLAARASLATLEAQLTAAKDQRDEADKVSMASLQLVVNAVKGDPEEGENGELYEAMGYVRKSERASGLHRGTPKPPPAG